ncbi:MAG: hypothetical protein RBT05_03520 [Bacteroidales bacterium]|jgi:hypothetical protein|nr:hypothetical protein [Bacteroidales bacterium]
MFYRGKKKIDYPVFFNNKDIKKGQEMKDTEIEKSLKKIADNNLLEKSLLDFLDKATASYKHSEKSRRRKEIDTLLSLASQYNSILPNRDELIKEREELR